MSVPLRLVNEHGEVVTQEGLHDRLAQMQDEIDGLNTELRAWRARYANLKRDVEAEAKAHSNWPAFIRLFALWKQLGRHPNSKATADRFWQAEPFIAKYGETMVERAIRGHTFDPFTSRRKNGTTKRFDGWELCFRTADKFEEAANRAPIEPPTTEAGPSQEPASASLL